MNLAKLARCSLSKAPLAVELRPGLAPRGARGAAASGLLEQLRRAGPQEPPQEPSRGSATREALPTPALPSRLGRVAVADRDFLLATAGGGQQVLLHDYRDVRLLKRITAGGIFGALMSSSGLAYAVSINLSAAACGGLVLQTAGAAFMLVMYLRTYVARAVLDPRRARLVLIGCGLFGEPMANEQHIPLAGLEPGVSRSDGYLKFRVRGASWDPSCWIWYRMPRSVEGREAKPGAQVGYRPATAVQPTPGVASSSGLGMATADATIAAARRFPGAGLGTETAPKGEPPQPIANAADPRKVGGLRVPSSMTASATGAQSSITGEGEGAVPRKSLIGLRLQHGLPADGAEEQKIIDFFDDPTAYAVTRA